MIKKQNNQSGKDMNPLILKEVSLNDGLDTSKAKRLLEEALKKPTVIDNKKQDNK